MVKKEETWAVDNRDWLYAIFKFPGPCYIFSGRLFHLKIFSEDEEKTNMRKSYLIYKEGNQSKGYGKCTDCFLQILQRLKVEDLSEI